MTSWERPAVRESLLRLQNRDGVDVIFLLFACWHPRPIPDQTWRRLQAQSAHWHRHVTRRIRALRRRVLATGWSSACQALLALELRAEMREAFWLAGQAAAGPGLHCDRLARIMRLYPTLPLAETRALIAALHLPAGSAGPNAGR